MKANIEKDAIPDGWQRVRLGDVAEVNRSNWDPSDGSSILYLDLTAVSAPGMLSPARLVQAADAPSRARRRVASDDILVSTVRPNLRGFARVREASDNLVASTGFAIVTPLERVDCSFAYHHVMTSQFADHLVGATTGQAYPAVRPIDVEAYPLLLPPLSEQRAIAAVLDSIDDAIQGTEAVIAATEGLRDALLHDLLTRGLPGQHTELRDVPGIGTIPADWDVVRLGDVADVIMGQSPSGSLCNRAGEGVPLLNGPTEYGPDHPEPAQWTTDARKMSREGDVLFCVRGATAGRMNWADRDYAIGRGVAAIRHKSGFSFQMFLRAVVDYYLPKLLSVVTGSTFPNLSYDQITQLQVPGIPLAEQQAIATTLEGVDAAIEVARTEQEGLRLMKESSAEALLTGKIRVNAPGASNFG